jgi:hypothetical protein
MSTTLSVKNEHTDPVVITADDGSDPVSVGPGGEADLTAAYLRGEKFRELLREGKLRLVYTREPTAEQYRLARQVLPPILQRLGGPALSLFGLLTAGKEQLRADAESYNRRWALVRDTVGQAADAEKGTEFLFKGAEHFLNTALEEKAVSEVEEEIADLEGEDLAATGRTLAEWYADRRAKEDELKAAQARLEAAQIEQAQLRQLIEALEEAAAAFKEANPSEDIGAKVSAWWEG